MVFATATKGEEDARGGLHRFSMQALRARGTKVKPRRGNTSEGPAHVTCRGQAEPGAADDGRAHTDAIKMGGAPRVACICSQGGGMAS